ncbi:hypothetical protein [Ornithinimicrobium cavernae]|uniref:hypothetical protein n=1 Tax=Ornithinimicrobium cavernae TaxID=2666047 RepID=UPI000D68BA91|nr:hypothetical protein [Ornithinimicrobium cavernae]
MPPVGFARQSTARRASTRWERLRRALVAFVVTGAVGLLLWYLNVLRFDLVTAVVVALAVGAVVTLLTWVMSEESPRLKPAYWFATVREESVRPAALDYRMLRLRRDLRDATERNDRVDEIFPVVRALAAERLLAHHDIDLATDREAAEAVMHPELTTYLSRPPVGTGRRSKRDIDRALDRIEEL